MNTFDRIITAALLSIALASAFVVNASMNELNAINSAPGRALATKLIADNN